MSAAPAANSVLAALHALPFADAKARIAKYFCAGDRDRAMDSWFKLAHAGQLPPGSAWRTWLILAGRGFGKTRAGAEWVQWHAANAERDKPCHIALVGATYDDVRHVMIEGPAGLLSVGDPHERAYWEPSKRQLTWPSGAIGRIYSGEKPDGLRGGEHSFAWCDEVAKWAYPGAAWANLQMALRQGAAPRVIVTTTPRPGPFLTGLRAAPGTIETRGRTQDNEALPASFIASMEAQYAGTRLGRQELDGEVLNDAEGALWTRDMMEACRLHHRGGKAGGPPDRHDWQRVVVAVDPPAGSSRAATTHPRSAGAESPLPQAGGDECGIIAAGLRRDGKIIILADASVSGSAPHIWAKAVADCAEKWQADRVVAEANNGGEMVRSVLLAADANLPVKLVHASKGKTARAEPVSTYYQQGRVKHAFFFAELEDQLCGLTIHGYEGPGRSPDRADALVWAVTELAQKRREFRVRSLAPEVVPVVRELGGGYGVVGGG